MGDVLTFDQAHWSTMRMVQEAAKWCKDRNREDSFKEHRDVLKTLISLGRDAA